MRKYTEEELRHLAESLTVVEFNGRLIELEDKLWHEAVSEILASADFQELMKAQPMQEAFPYRFSIRLEGVAAPEAV